MSTFILRTLARAVITYTLIKNMDPIEGALFILIIECAAQVFSSINVYYNRKKRSHNV